MIDYGVTCRPMPGEAESGDMHLVREWPGRALIAVVDGLGHGPEAAVAARAAIETIEANAREAIGALVRRCHQRLRPTRGVVLNIALIDFLKENVTWLGVGNILGLLVHAGPDFGDRQTFLVSRGGVVGQHLPSVQTVTLPIIPGDTLIFATDGVSQEFSQALGPAAGPQEMADQILRDHAVDTDDALVLVVRYRGGAGEPGPATLLR